MKKWAIVFLSAFAGACQSPQLTVPDVFIDADKQPDLHFENGLLWHKNHPFSGYVLRFSASGKRLSKEAYVAGKAESVHEKWDENGRLLEQRGYVNNHKHGIHRGWWPNGNRKFEYHFADDLPIETHSEWYVNGQLFTRFNYDRLGQPEGSQQMWYSTGQIKANYVVKNGRRYGLLGAKGCMGENERARTQLFEMKNP
ncbi:MAG: toxin-antitoxin system YwqK family antitoxin [Spirosomataceae bacterium]